MSASTLFFQAFGAGFAIAAPIGPIGMLCLQRTLQQSPAHGLVTGLGAASADACHALLGVLGLGALVRVLGSLVPWIELLGAGSLIWMGISGLRGRTATAAASAAGSLLASWTSALALTLSNPMTILSFLALFLQLSGHSAPGIQANLLMVAGIFTGSALWWLILSQGLGRVLRHQGETARRGMNRLFGTVLTGMGVWLVVAAILQLRTAY
jgi:threonine/homoserine/homoserine lactone efflux protein